MNDQNDSNASSDAFQANRLNNSNKVTPLISTPFISESLSYDNDGQPESSHKYCKICFESSSHISQMISPCKCNGSLKWVHENCLKSWLLTLDKDLAELSCEICKTKFHMEFVIDSKFDCKMIFQQSASHNFIVIVLLGIIFLLFSMVVILIKSYLPKLEGDKKSYMVILVTLCLTTGIIMCGVVYNFFKNSANLSKLTTWKIFDQEFEDKMIYKLDENGSPEFPEYVSPNRYSPLLKIPNFIIINHRKMPTPDIQSPCVSICDNSVISGHALLSMTVLENSFSNAHSSDLIRIIPEI